MPAFRFSLSRNLVADQAASGFPVHAGQKGGKERDGNGKTHGGLNTKIHAIAGKDLRPVAFLLSAENVDDCTEAVSLLKLLPDLKDCDILADKAYGTKEIRTYLHDQSARYTIPPKVNTKQLRPFDKETYKRRNVIERFFNRLKELHRAETRYDKRDDSFLAFVMVAASCVAFSILHI